MHSLSTNNDFAQGVEALESENYARAIATFQQWLEKHPEDLECSLAQKARLYTRFHSDRYIGPQWNQEDISRDQDNQPFLH